MASAIWILIKQHLQSEGLWEDQNPARARILTEEEEREAERERVRDAGEQGGNR